MTKRQARKAAYKAIFKENKSHNEAFEEIRPNVDLGREELANLLAAIPSVEKHKETKTIWMIYSGLLGLVILLRLAALGLMVSIGMIDMNPIIILTILVFGLIVPAMGIFGAVTGRRETLFPVGMLLVLGVIRNLRNGSIEMSPEQIGVFVLIGAILVLIFILSNKWKTPYKKEVTTVEVNGVAKKQLSIKFEDTAASNPNVLDDIKT